MSSFIYPNSQTRKILSKTKTVKHDRIAEFSFHKLLKRFIPTGRTIQKQYNQTATKTK